MKHRHHDIFIEALHAQRKVEMTYDSQKDGTIVSRTAAPMDFGPRANEKVPTDRYHFWDYDSPSGAHTSSLEAGQIHSITILDDTFDPADFVKWTPKWHVDRDWGSYS
jgi:hypothetical protein